MRSQYGRAAKSRRNNLLRYRRRSGFQEEDILKQCEYAKKEEITDVPKEHSINNVEFEIRAQMYSFSSETSVITVKEIENATKLFTEMCKEYENVQMKKIKKNMKLNKLELIRFALRAEVPFSIMEDWIA